MCCGCGARWSLTAALQRHSGRGSASIADTLQAFKRLRCSAALAHGVVWRIPKPVGQPINQSIAVYLHPLAVDKDLVPDDLDQD